MYVVDMPGPSSTQESQLTEAKFTLSDQQVQEEGECESTESPALSKESLRVGVTTSSNSPV